MEMKLQFRRETHESFGFVTRSSDFIKHSNTYKTARYSYTEVLKSAFQLKTIKVKVISLCTKVSIFLFQIN